MTAGFPPESTNAAILHARQCLATIGDTQMVQIGREQLQWLVEAATAYEAYDRQCGWVQSASVGPLGWHVARIMTDMIYAAYPALRPTIAAHRAEAAAGQGAVIDPVTSAEEARVAAAADAILKDLRGRKLLKYLFAEDPDGQGAYGPLNRAIDVDAQRECVETWARLAFATTAVVSGAERAK